MPAWAIPTLWVMHAEYCRIERWRGYFSSSFYVHLPDQTLESQSFRWRRQAPPPESGSARAAYDELVSRIERAGWKRHADGVDWFATTFTRFVETPAEVRFERVADVMPQEPPPMRVVVPVQQPPAASSGSRSAAGARAAAARAAAGAAAGRAAPAPAPVPGRGRRWVAPTAVGAFVVAAVAAGFLILEQRGNGKPAAAEGVTRTVAAHLSTGSSGAAPITKGVEGSAHSVVAKAGAGRPPNRGARQRVVARDPSRLRHRPDPLQRHAHRRADPALPRAEAVGAVRRGVEPDDHRERPPGAHPGHVREAVRRAALSVRACGQRPCGKGPAAEAPPSTTML